MYFQLLIMLSKSMLVFMNLIKELYRRLFFIIIAHNILINYIGIFIASCFMRNNNQRQDRFGGIRMCRVRRFTSNDGQPTDPIMRKLTAYWITVQECGRAQPLASKNTRGIFYKI